MLVLLSLVKETTRLPSSSSEHCSCLAFVLAGFSVAMQKRFGLLFKNSRLFSEGTSLTTAGGSSGHTLSWPVFKPSVT